MKVVGLLGPESPIQKYTWYTNASMMVSVLEGTVVAKGNHFVKILVFVDNTCQALLADQLGSFGMGLVKFPHTKIKKPPNNHKNSKTL